MQCYIKNVTFPSLFLATSTYNLYISHLFPIPCMQLPAFPLPPPLSFIITSQFFNSAILFHNPLADNFHPHPLSLLFCLNSAILFPNSLQPIFTITPCLSYSFKIPLSFSPIPCNQFSPSPLVSPILSKFRYTFPQFPCSQFSPSPLVSPILSNSAILFPNPHAANFYPHPLFFLFCLNSAILFPNPLATNFHPHPLSLLFCLNSAIFFPNPLQPIFTLTPCLSYSV